MSLFRIFLIHIFRHWDWISLHIHSECGKKRNRKTPNTDTFQPVIRTGTVYQQSAKLSTILSLFTSTFTRAIVLTGGTEIKIKEDSNIQKRCTELWTHFSPVSHFYTPWKRQKNFGFLTFSGGIEMWHWTKMG